MKLKISIIVPIYNTAQYLDKCLTSILNQTMQEIEIICVDDCSSDDSHLIVEKYAKQDSRVSLIRHEINKGSGGARNTGILAAKARFLASVDSDDYILPEMMQALWDASEAGIYDVVCCGYDSVNKEGAKVASHALHPKKFHNMHTIDIFSVVNPAFWNKLWRKSLFIDNDIFFPEKLYYQDLATIPRILSKVKKMKVIKGNYYNYLVRENATTTTFSKKHISDYFDVFDILLQFLKNNQLLDRYEYVFVNTIDANVYYHVKNFIKSDLGLEQQNIYLAELYLAKNLYLKSNFNLSRTSFDLANSNAKAMDNQNRLLKLFMPINQLSFQQKMAVKVSGLILKVFLSPNQQIKLRENPIGFFGGSKSIVTRSIGSFFKII